MQQRGRKQKQTSLPKTTIRDKTLHAQINRIRKKELPATYFQAKNLIQV